MIKIIVGLGNPGIKYAETRHNIGAWYIQKLALKYNKIFEVKKKFFCFITKIKINNHEIFLLMPNTFMNLSGIVVKKFISYYQILPEEILIVHDDLYLNVGHAKFKKNNSDGGHNGVKNIIENLKSKNFYRLRIGIGRPINNTIVNFVLKKPSYNEIKEINKSIEKSINSTEIFFQCGYCQATQFLHN